MLNLIFIGKGFLKCGTTITHEELPSCTLHYTSDEQLLHLDIFRSKTFFSVFPQ